MRPKKPYHKRRSSKKQIELFCGQVGPGDGSDPRYDPPKSEGKRGSGRKALQLCRQVREALSDALASVCDDPLLRELNVISVEPAPNATRLQVTLELTAGVAEPGEVAPHLERAAGLLRCEVAAAIHRKKVPELAFRVVTP